MNPNQFVPWVVPWDRPPTCNQIADVVGAAERLAQLIRQVGRASGLTPFEAKVILVLGDDGLTSHDMAAVLGIGADDNFRSMARRTVSTLRRDGLVRGGDSRGVLTPVRLTPRGILLRDALISSLVNGNGNDSPELADAAPEPT